MVERWILGSVNCYEFDIIVFCFTKNDEKFEFAQSQWRLNVDITL